MNFALLVSFQDVDSWIEDSFQKARHLLLWAYHGRRVRLYVDERKRHESLQNGLHKTQHSVNHGVYEERAHNKSNDRGLVSKETVLRRWKSKTLK